MMNAYIKKEKTYLLSSTNKRTILNKLREAEYTYIGKIIYYNHRRGTYLIKLKKELEGWGAESDDLVKSLNIKLTYGKYWWLPKDSIIIKNIIMETE